MVVQKIYDVDELLERYRSRPAAALGRIVSLMGLDGLDGYNPSAPIRLGSSTYALVRIEPRNVEFGSWSVPFRQLAPDRWEREPDMPMLRLEDPCVSIVHGELVVGGVRIVARLGTNCMWETVFFRGRSLMDLEEFACSPLSMKDVRLVELDDGRVGVFTRPWGDAASSRHIGYTEINSLNELNRPVMAEAPVLPTQPIDGQWWGVNAAYPLSDGTIGVLAHMAKWDGGERRYYAVSFVFDRSRREIVEGPDIVADRSCFPPHEARAADLRDVIFPAWIDRDQGLLYAGLSDAAVGVMPIDDPFAEHDPVRSARIA